MAKPLEATLVDLNNKPKAFDLGVCQEKPLEIGRRKGSDIQIDSDLVSGQHATIQWQDPFYTLTDNSKNGTHITFDSGMEGTLTTTKCEPGVPYQLRKGDRIVFVAEPIGHFKVIF
jgi:pSer/pThr/pTyr-binding forkhead associated (FHA) protein